MTTQKKVIKSTLFLSAGRGMERGFQFLRNIIVARIVSPADFGIATLFTMTVSFLEMISNLAVDTLLVQSPHGDKRDFQRTSQLIVAVRGVGIAFLLLLFAGPVAKLFDVPKATWAFRLLAVVPLIRGLAHQDMSRFQRQLDFKPQLITDVSSQFVSVLFAWPLAAWLGDYSAILFLIIIQTMVRTLMSHLTAERRYTWGWEPEYARRIISFGLPLLINGILLYLIVQGDRFVIGAADQIFGRETYSKVQLGFYSAAFVLSSTIREAIGSVLMPVMLPLLSRANDAKEHLERTYHYCIQIVVFIAVPLGIFFILIGGWLMIKVYGSQYAAGAPLIAWLGAINSLYLLRIIATTIALSKGDSVNPTVCNVFRAFSFAIVFGLAARGAPIVWIAASGLVGEILAIMTSMAMLRYRQTIPLRLFAKPLLLSLGSLALAALIWKAGVYGAPPLMAGLAAVGLSLIMAAFFLLLFPDFRNEIKANITPWLKKKQPI